MAFKLFFQLELTYLNKKKERESQFADKVLEVYLTYKEQLNKNGLYESFSLDVNFDNESIGINLQPKTTVKKIEISFTPKGSKFPYLNKEDWDKI